MVVSRSRPYASGYGDLTLGSQELEEEKNLRIHGITFDSKLTFDTHLREVVSKAARSFGAIRQKRNLFNCPRLLKSYVNANILPNLQYCALMCMSFVETHLSLLNSVVCGAEGLCEG